MKKLLILGLLFQVLAFGQENYKFSCGSFNSGEELTDYTPSFGPCGTLKMLVVFCKFSDDDFDESPITDMWPSALDTMPSWGSSFISSNISTEYSKPSLSGYFNDMSFGNFQVIGDVVYYCPQHERSYYYYTGGLGINYLSEEILTGINNSVDYANYDNWDTNDNDHDGIRNEPDGKVDMIVIAFRTGNGNIYDVERYQGKASLTGYSIGFYSGTTLSFDGVTIDRNSGIFEFNCLDLHSTIRVTAHELGHYLFGPGHYIGVGYHGLMDGGGSGIVSSYEACKLG